jgi:hypothetical protein
MILAINALSFPFVNEGHEVTSLALKLKLVSHRWAFLGHIMMSPAHRGTEGAQKDDADSSVGDVCSGH